MLKSSTGVRRLLERTGVLCLAAFVALLAGATSTQAAAVKKAAVFDLELIDTSGEPVSPAHPERLALVSRRLREQLAASGRFIIVDPAAVAARVATLGHIHGCNGCEADLAKAMGADVAVSGLVRKISTLIASVSLAMRDAGSGQILFAASVDIRGDTDEAWLRGVSYIVRNRLLESP